MTEKDKQAKGILYDSGDPELCLDRRRCKDLCFAYNQLPPSHREDRRKLLKQLLGKTGERLHIEPTFWCDYGYNISVGENFYMNHNCVILDCAAVTFGDHVLIAPNCGFYTAGHPLDPEQRNQGLEYAYPITVGSNVWIGGSCVILPGVKIGDNCIIGAGSVVTKDIPADCVAVGNPCRVLRKITAADRDKYRSI